MSFLVYIWVRLELDASYGGPSLQVNQVIRLAQQNQVTKNMWEVSIIKTLITEVICNKEVRLQIRASQNSP